MNIGFFTDSYKPNTDGVVVSITNFKSELEKKGASVFVYAPGSRGTIALNNDRKIHYYPSLPFPPYPQYRIAVPRGITLDAKKDSIDLVHCHALTTMGFAAVRASQKLGVPLIGTFHTLIPNGVSAITSNKLAQKIGGEIAWKAIRRFYRPFPLVTAPSKTIARLLKEHGVENTCVVPNGIDLRKFKPQSQAVKQSLRKKLGLSPSDKMLLVAGRQSREKNVDVVIRAYAGFAKENPGSKLVVCGSGPALGENTALASRLG
ncbi:glycosyltransferase, partial [Candidatus Micrarchaeota archaeon]|nr:glycosyltransferase [Candidatus Micrarchaeota archaeon]